MTFAVSGFVFGLVCVTMAYNVISDFVSSAALDEPPRSTELGGQVVLQFDDVARSRFFDPHTAPFHIWRVRIAAPIQQ